MKFAILVCTLDTKGIECEFIKKLIEEEGIRTLTIDTGIMGKSYYHADVPNDEIAQLGGQPLEQLTERGDRGIAVETMMNGVIAKVTELYREGKVGGILALGGSAGTTIGTAAMRELPVGIPKVMLSTIASGDTRSYVGTKDVTMVNTIVDISGLNAISRKTLANGAYALTGMMKGRVQDATENKPIIAVTMFGVTTPCVTAAREYLEDRGYEVLPFHATGIGGQSMESLIESGLIAGVLDITTTEIADEVAGGTLSAGPNRLNAACLRRVPQVVSVGALDMANFGGMETVPEKFKHRLLYKHNPNVTLMRTTIEDNVRIGEFIAEKLNRSRGPVAVCLPLRGLSALDAEGAPFHGPKENEALFETIRHKLNPGIQLIERDAHINDHEFAVAMAEKLLELMNEEN